MKDFKTTFEDFHIKKEKMKITWEYVVSIALILFGLGLITASLIPWSLKEQAAKKSLAVCQQKNAELKDPDENIRKIRLMLDTLIREHEMARPCYPDCLPLGVTQ